MNIFKNLFKKKKSALDIALEKYRAGMQDFIGIPGYKKDKENDKPK